VNLAATYTVDALRHVSDDLLALEKDEQRLQERRRVLESRCHDLTLQLNFLKSQA